MSKKGRKKTNKLQRQLGSPGFSQTSTGYDGAPGQMSHHLFLEWRTPAALEIGRRRPTQQLLIFSSFFFLFVRDSANCVTSRKVLEGRGAELGPFIFPMVSMSRPRFTRALLAPLNSATHPDIHGDPFCVCVKCDNVSDLVGFLFWYQIVVLLYRHNYDHLIG